MMLKKRPQKEELELMLGKLPNCVVLKRAQEFE